MKSFLVSNLFIAQSIFVLFFFAKPAQPTEIFGSITNTVYQEIFDLGADRIRSEPLTEKDCWTEGTVAYDLKSCQLMRDDPSLLRSISSQFFTSSFHSWSAKVSRSLQPSSRSWSRSRWSRFRKKRDSNEKVLSRKKRGIPGNPCVGYESVKTVVLFAVDSETGEVVELLQDPITGLYQTFFTYDCTTSYVGFLCEPQHVEFLTAVYTGNYYDVEVRQVSVPTHCAVSISW